MALSHADAAQAAAAGSVDALAARFAPDYTPEQMENLGVYDSLYRGQSPRLASLGEWKPEWINPVDPKGWAQWYKRYASGRRIVDEDARQMKRWLSFKARHGQEFIKNPTPRRGWALRNWGIDPANLVSKEQRPVINEMLDAYKNDAMKAYLAARMQPESAAEKQASNAARRLLTKLMKDTAAGNLRWSGRSVSTAENIARTGIFRGGDGDPMFSRHIPLAMYSRVGKGGTALGFTRAAPEYRFRPQNSHYASKRFFPNTAIGRPSETAHPAKAFFMTEGVKGNMPVPARAGVLRYAVDTGDPKVNALLRNHGARIMPQKLFQHFNDQRIPTSTQLSQAIRQMIGNWSLNANPGAGVFTRNDALRHLATFNAPKSPGVAPSAPSTWLDAARRWLRGVPNMFKRSAAEQAAKTFYHGTDSKNLKSILARGLDPEFAGTGADSGVPTDIPGYERRVFLATHPQLNSGYGDARLKVELPEYFDVKPLFPWPLSTFMTDHYTTQKIPAKYIKHEKQAADLPWRERVEVLTRHPRTGKIYGGMCDSDKAFAAPGGGIDPGETPEQAAVRELAEETGIHATNPVRLPIGPVDNAWNDEYRARTGRNFAGSRTHFVLADYVKRDKNKQLDFWSANNRKFYTPEQALAMMQGKQPMAPPVAQGREQALRHVLALMQQNQQKQADFQPHILVSGHSGAGKSTLAKALAEKLHMPYAQVDKRPEFTEFLANNTPETHLPANAPKNQEFRKLLQTTALKTLQDADQPSIIEGAQLAYLPAELLQKFKHIHVNTPLSQTYQQRLERTKRRYLKDPTKEWTPEIEAEKKRTADLVYAFHRDAFKNYDKLPGTLKYKPGQNIDKLIARLQKQADLLPDVQLQEHQQRVADKLTTNHPRLLLYHGLGTGKSLSALAAAEAAKKVTGDEYGVVVPASLRDNFKKEINKFTTSNPEIMSYTGLGMGKRFKSQPDTLIVDEAARLRNPEADSSRAITDAAQKAKRVMLLTGTPITNEPKDLASLISILHGQPLSPEIFDKEFLDEEKVYPGWWGWLNGAKPGMKVVMRNGPKLRQLLAGRVDYQPSKTPEGVNVNETIVRAPLTAEQQKIQRAIRTQIAPGFLWKLDKEFPLSKAELSKLNSFLTGLRQISLSTQPFRSDRDPLRAFYQSGKMQTAFDRLKAVLESDPRKKALIYSNFIDAGLQPYAAKLTEAKIPHALFHGGISAKARQAAVDAYNNNKLRALLIGPAGAEGLSTKGTSLIQLLDPHWNEARSQQARGRGLRFDSHVGLPEDLKNVDVERYLSHSEEPSLFGKILGYQRTRTADELLERLTAEKEQLNEQFRDLLKEVGSRGATADR